MEKLLTLEEVANILRVSVSHVRRERIRWQEEFDFRPCRIGGKGRLLFTEEDVKSLLNKWRA